MDRLARRLQSRSPLSVSRSRPALESERRPTTGSTRPRARRPSAVYKLHNSTQYIGTVAATETRDCPCAARAEVNLGEVGSN